MKILFTCILIILLTTCLFGQNEPYKVGTTAAPFLELAVGSAGVSMGDAYVSVARDVTSIYWNPSGLAYLNSNEVQFMQRPWIAGISTSFAGGATAIPGIGTLAAGISAMNFGSTEVTTMELQDGTGETFSALEYAVSLSFARKIVSWFAFGITGKYISSEISRMKASAIAMDLGVMINTPFFAVDGNQENGLTIGMSISNYGTRMKYDGIELLRPIDILPNEHGNYQDVEGMYRLQSWDLPIIFRLGASIHPIVTATQKLTLAIDALHPNNNSESLNAGAEYQIKLRNLGTIFIRGGWHAWLMDDSPYGLALGGGVQFTLPGNILINVDYAFQDVEYFNNYSVYTIGIDF